MCDYSSKTSKWSFHYAFVPCFWTGSGSLLCLCWSYCFSFAFDKTWAISYELKVIESLRIICCWKILQKYFNFGGLLHKKCWKLWEIWVLSIWIEIEQCTWSIFELVLLKFWSAFVNKWWIIYSLKNGQLNIRMEWNKTNFFEIRGKQIWGGRFYFKFYTIILHIKIISELKYSLKVFEFHRVQCFLLLHLFWLFFSSGRVLMDGCWNCWMESVWRGVILEEIREMVDWEKQDFTDDLPTYRTHWKT